MRTSPSGKSDGDLTPIIVGVGDITERTAPPRDISPLSLMVAAARVSIADAGSADISGMIDSVAAIRLFSDSSSRYASPFGRAENPAEAVAKAIGAPAEDLVYGPVGGTSPLALLKRLCAAVQAGEVRAGLIVGSEAMRSEQQARRSGIALDWNTPAEKSPLELRAEVQAPNSETERRHGLSAPVHFYPLLENAFRSLRRRSVVDHQADLGRLMAGFAEVAARNPLAAKPIEPDPDVIAYPLPGRSWLAFPYTSRMVAQVFVDQGAALLVTSVARARALGILEVKWIYPHAIAEAREQWLVSERQELGAAPALEAVGRQVLSQCGIGINDIRHLDVYSCFPVAIETGCAALGLPQERWPSATVTGGLPYFGGPGNNYVTHALSAVARLLRRDPGCWGMVTGVSYYLSKQAAAVLSARAPRHPVEWAAETPLQRHLDARAPVVVDVTPCGAAKIETYTVTTDREGRPRGIVLGRLDGSNRRFIANVPSSETHLQAMVRQDMLGQTGIVHSDNGQNLFIPAA